MPTTIEKFDVRNTATGEVEFVAEITTTPGMRYADKLGRAIVWGLENVDLRRVNIDEVLLPVIENIHQRVYAAASVPGAFNRSRWHTRCGAAHCRAGHVVVLAGAAGRALEEKVGTAMAATLIYMASDPELARVPDWYASNADALADMQALAEAEKEKST